MKKNDCLKTPEWVYRTFGAIDLDPCAAVDTKIGKTNYAIERGEDGLSLPWFGFVYCNPPFSQKAIWTQRILEHGKGILLLPERGSAPWFGPLAKRVRYYFVLGKKINFEGGPSSNNLGTVLFPIGPEAMWRLTQNGLPGHMVEVKTFQPRAA